MPLDIPVLYVDVLDPGNRMSSLQKNADENAGSTAAAGTRCHE